jgi:hypothetical protein
MRYLKGKLRAIGREYMKKDREQIIAASGNKCTICSRKNGDEFLFGPTNYLKQQIKFKVCIEIHVIDGSNNGRHLIVLCSGCHLSYHLFNRLSESADMGGQKLSQTLYKRCDICKELSCMCCKTCGQLPKWCACGKPVKKKAVSKVPASGRVKLRSGK